jgi:hypothetical protein
MVNSFLNGKKNLSPAANRRVMGAIDGDFEKKKVEDNIPITAEALAQHPRLAAQVAKEFNTQFLHEVKSFIDLRKAVDPNNLLDEHEARITLAGPPRDLMAYRAWKAKQIEIHAAADELPTAKAWIKEMEKRRDDLQERVSHLEQIQSLNEELVALYKGLVDRLKKQLIDAGLTPTD